MPVSIDAQARLPTTVVVGRDSAFPRAYFCVVTLPSRRTSIFSDSASALTTDAPTPCSPPDTL